MAIVRVANSSWTTSPLRAPPWSIARGYGWPPLRRGLETEKTPTREEGSGSLDLIGPGGGEPIGI